MKRLKPYAKNGVPYVSYYSNNSGGYDWLEGHQWQALVDDGWDVIDFNDQYLNDGGIKDTRWKYALIRDVKLGEAIRRWERATGMDSSALGCSCCGVPHQFYEYDAEGRTVDEYSPSFPRYGDRYDDW